ncbi:phage terminase small subunit P27 family [Nocardia brasiliensis]|uniref:phage terminase small subunit P27 family n=1 Tax=Nocardia brasiliensis TaxID=37326 RepID=UPI0033E24EE9
MARNPAPASLKLLTGRAPGRDSGGRVVNTLGFETGTAPEPPDWLHGDALEEWNRVVPMLARLKIIKAEDRTTLAAYCQAVAVFTRASQELNEQGLTIMTTVKAADGTTQRKPMANPLWRVVKESGAELLRYAKEFGLTPVAEQIVARGRATRKDEDDPGNPFANQGRPS